jgi:2-phosphoglycerate kinase
MGGVLKTMIKTVRKGRLDVTGIVITAGLALVQSVINKPGIQANLKHFIDKILPGNKEDKHYHKEVLGVADEIVKLFESRKVSPNCIAVDGVPGSGKSTLAVELADRLGMEVECLDHRNMDEPTYL